MAHRLDSWQRRPRLKIRDASIGRIGFRAGVAISARANLKLHHMMSSKPVDQTPQVCLRQ